MELNEIKLWDNSAMVLIISILWMDQNQFLVYSQHQVTAMSEGHDDDVSQGFISNTFSIWRQGFLFFWNRWWQTHWSSTGDRNYCYEDHITYFSWVDNSVEVFWKLKPGHFNLVIKMKGKKNSWKYYCVWSLRCRYSHLLRSRAGQSKQHPGTKSLTQHPLSHLCF